MHRISLLFFIPLSFQVMAQSVLPKLGSESLPQGVNITPFVNGMIINSSETNNVIKWESFDVGKDGTVYFSDDHAYLNLVTGGKGSVIDGVVTSGLEGSRIYLVNPAGITVNGRISGFDIGLYTARLTKKDLDVFKQTGSLSPDIANGMGRVSLLGKINATNLEINAGQIIIKDINRIKRTGHDYPLTDIRLSSSVNRIDIGAGMSTEGEINLEEKYGFKKDQGIINHTGAMAVSTASELRTAVAGNPDARVFLTNDIDLGHIESSLDNGRGFTGQLDGAFNNISYTFSQNFEDKSVNAGLFSTLNGATVSALGIKATLSLSNYGQDSTVGALAGTCTNSHIDNVRAYDTTISLSGRHDRVLYAGGLTGRLYGGNISDTVSSLNDSSSTILNRIYPHSTGAIAGAADGLFRGTGLIAGLGDRAFGNIQSDLVITDFTDQKEDHGVAEGFVFDDNNRLNQKGFYDPFFMIDDQYYEYDDQRKAVPSYRSILFDDLFKDEVYVKLNPQTDGSGNALFDENSISDSGTYRHYLSSSPNSLRGYYFVKTTKNDDGTVSYKASHLGLGLITIGPKTKTEENATPQISIPKQENSYSLQIMPEVEEEKDYGNLFESSRLMAAHCSFCNSKADFSGEIMFDSFIRGPQNRYSLYPFANARTYSAFSSPYKEYETGNMQLARANKTQHSYSIIIRPKAENLAANSSISVISDDDTLFQEAKDEKPQT